MNTKLVLFIVFALVLLAGLFFVLKPKEEFVTSIQNQKSEERVFEIVIKSRKLISGSNVLQVKEGDSVNMKITIDENEELHLHGYDKSIDLVKDVQSSLSFTASLTGSFHFELEKSGIEVGTLEVLPN